MFWRNKSATNVRAVTSNIDQNLSNDSKNVQIDSPALSMKSSPLAADHVQAIIASQSFADFIALSQSVMNVPGFFAGDTMLLCGKNLGFLSDKKFMNSFQRAYDRYENPALHHVLTQLIWRKHILASAAQNCLLLNGDFVECGVEYGFGVDVVSDYINFADTNKTWWLYDTFAGVPAEQLDSGTKPNPDLIDKEQYQKVKTKFSSQPRFNIIQGMVPQSFSQGMPENIAYLHIDMNNARAEIGALIALLDRVVIGGHVILDDYGWLAFARQHNAETLLFAELGFRIMELPTGQGLFVKTTPTNASTIDAETILNLAEAMAIQCHAYPKLA